MNTNKFEFENSFDSWLDADPDYKKRHNPFVEIMAKLIKDWPEVPKIDL